MFLAANAYSQNPILAGTYYDTATIGFSGRTVSVNWNDAETVSGYFSLAASSTSIQQVPLQPLGIDINTAEQAAQFAFLDPSWLSAIDSNWLTGVGSAWTAATPPFSGVDPATGVPGSNMFRASYGTAPGTPLFGQTPILQLVTNDPEGDASSFGR